MIFIVAHHGVVNSGLAAVDGPIYANPLSFKALSLLLLGAWEKSGINCFVLITGYFMCKSSISVKKFLKLILEWMFYRYLIYLIFLIAGYEHFSVKNIILTIVPITRIDTNFIACFVVFWLFIPFLNKLVHNLKEKQHLELLCLCFFIYVILGTFKQVTMNYVSWFIVLYFISSYLRLYPKKCFSKISLWGVLFFFSIIISGVSVVLCVWFGVKMNRNMAYYFVTDSNAFLALFVGICGFMFFKNLKINYNKVINTIAASTFGVLLIHANSDTMRKFLWEDLIDFTGHYYSSRMLIYFIGSIIAIFIICVIIDQVRRHCFEKPFFIMWDKHWNGISIWIKKIEYRVLNGIGCQENRD